VSFITTAEAANEQYQQNGSSSNNTWPETESNTNSNGRNRSNANSEGDLNFFSKIIIRI
jgi:hypothetical protein